MVTYNCLLTVTSVHIDKGSENIPPHSHLKNPLKENPVEILDDTSHATKVFQLSVSGIIIALYVVQSKHETGGFALLLHSTMYSGTAEMCSETVPSYDQRYNNKYAYKDNKLMNDGEQ